ncbi:Transcriptional regulator of acetoin/glycerol metabolism [Solimonas aquatica]|uniref:Transcriptional regulator of acetoin/glycerol metabolism n=1 Tax=Solimonas aquatica TaxID=489703 RepID=A0A1H9FU89_9GAMM|nr:sigma-54-dependent Fis family transcriptional regulator [Solimonas aquatica]SEQ41464.1 Transcriptional regulator of acetoin/glycerol metabolism [Solimonas aquatica]
MQAAPTSPDLAAARRRFFLDGQPPKGLVPETILRSWIRCAGLGLEESRAPRLEPLNARELREACERNEALRRLCRPELEWLHAEARGTESIVVLTDAQGLVLDTVGSVDFADRAAQVALRPGVSWQEGMTGTNAIGTALVERRPVEVRGGEHYFSPHRILSCYAAPIIDPQGQLAGALDLSGNANVPHLHALGMVRLAVDQIEHRLFEQRYADCEVLRLHKDATRLGTAREGILVFRDHQLIAANRHALELLDLDWQALTQTRYSDLFSTSLTQLRDGSRLRDRHHRELVAQLDRPRPRLTVPGTTPPLPAEPQPAPSALGNRPTPSAERLADPVVFDSALRHSLQRATRMLDAGLPVLLQGETGVGKEVFARRLHASCSRAQGPLISVNCAALPESLIEAELFGYEEGAFTGARKRGAPGLLRRADGGVLFLDEIGDMPLSLQTRLLRVLQEREVMPLGGERAVPVDFMLICATHAALDRAVAEGRFRADLYYRIAQYVVPLKPLREHADLRSLVAELWSNLPPPSATLPNPVLDALAAHHWPGNYRELSAALRMLKVLAAEGSPLCVDDLPPTIRREVAIEARPGALQALARDAMREALQACEGNVSAAAKKLGVSRSTLYRRVLSS